MFVSMKSAPSSIEQTILFLVRQASPHPRVERWHTVVTDVAWDEAR